MALNAKNTRLPGDETEKRRDDQCCKDELVRNVVFICWIKREMIPTNKEVAAKSFDFLPSPSQEDAQEILAKFFLQSESVLINGRFSSSMAEAQSSYRRTTWFNRLILIKGLLGDSISTQIKEPGLSVKGPVHLIIPIKQLPG